MVKKEDKDRSLDSKLTILYDADGAKTSTRFPCNPPTLFSLKLVLVD